MGGNRAAAGADFDFVRDALQDQAWQDADAETPFHHRRDGKILPGGEVNVRLHMSALQQVGDLGFSAVLQQQKRPDRLPGGGQADAAFTALQQRHAPFLLQIGEHL